MQTTEKILVLTFPDISPINTVSGGITSGHYNDHYTHITDVTVPLLQVEGKKTVHLVCFNEAIGETEYIERLKAIGKEPCRNTPNYLLGLMKQVSEDKMPPELRNYDIVAAEPSKSSVFTDTLGFHCFLYVGRGAAFRGLGLTDVGRKWYGHWAFLAEDLVS